MCALNKLSSVRSFFLMRCLWVGFGTPAGTALASCSMSQAKNDSDSEERDKSKAPAVGGESFASAWGWSPWSMHPSVAVRSFSARKDVICNQKCSPDAKAGLVDQEPAVNVDWVHLLKAK